MRVLVRILVAGVVLLAMGLAALAFFLTGDLGSPLMLVAAALTGGADIRIGVSIESPAPSRRASMTPTRVWPSSRRKSPSLRRKRRSHNSRQVRAKRIKPVFSPGRIRSPAVRQPPRRWPRRPH